MSIQHDVMDYAALIEERWHDGWSLFLLSFLFDQLPGDERAVQMQQTWLIEKAYGSFVTRAVRKPAAASATGRLPIWLCVPDFPVTKGTPARRKAFANDGQHAHGILCQPPFGRMSNGVADHFDRCQRLYVAHGGLRRVHAQRITTNPRYVWDYASKMVARRRVERDAVLLLPRARSEVRNLSKPVGRNSSIVG